MKPKRFDVNPSHALLWLSLSLLLFSVGCGVKAKLHSQIVGTWRMQPKQGVYMILAFHNNGTFEVDERIEGDLSKIVEKVGMADGTWKMAADGSRLTLLTRRGNPQIGWPAATVAYKLAMLDRNNLKLVDPEGNHQHWLRIRSSRQESAGAGKAELSVAPIVVNLAPSKEPTYHHYEWVCTKVNMTMNRYNSKAQLPARVREKIIFFLNSKTYQELNTQDKLTAAALQLKDTLNPYLDNRIVNLSFSNTILTGRAQVVDDFMAKYAAPKRGEAKK